MIFLPRAGTNHATLVPSLLTKFIKITTSELICNFSNNDAFIRLTISKQAFYVICLDEHNGPSNGNKLAQISRKPIKQQKLTYISHKVQVQKIVEYSKKEINASYNGYNSTASIRQKSYLIKIHCTIYNYSVYFMMK